MINIENNDFNKFFIKVNQLYEYIKREKNNRHIYSRTYFGKNKISYYSENNAIINLNIALKIREKLNRDGFKIGIVHAPTVKPLNKKQLYNFTKDSSFIITIEEQSIIGGLGGAISEILMENKPKNLKKFKRIGLPDIFPEGYGRQHNMMERYKIDFKGCLSKIKKIIK